MTAVASRGSSTWRAASWGKGCDPNVIVSVPWVIGAPKIQCHRDAWPAFRALGRIMREHGYVIRGDDTGCYVCRKITGGTSPSSHAQGIGIDVNWLTNPYRLDKLVTDMPDAMIAAVHGLQTLSGLRVFRWGGDWDNRPDTKHSNYDAMHFELIVTPTELAGGFSVEAFDESKQSAWPLLVEGDHGPAVAQLQQHLGVFVDGDYGPKTRVAVEKWQRSRGLTVDGWVGLGTWTSLLTEQPKLERGDPKPVKRNT